MQEIPWHAVACRCRLQAAMAMISKDACKSWNTKSLLARIDENTYHETKSCLTGKSRNDSAFSSAGMTIEVVITL
jgi:hypothetical protein